MFTRKDIELFNTAKHKHDLLESEITDRLDQIIDLIFKAFGTRRGTSHWYFEDAEEGEVGTLNLQREDIRWIIDPYPAKLYTQSYDYSSYCPRKFLLMEDDEIVAHIQKQIKIDQEKKEKRKKQAKARREEKKKLIESAKKKLTKEEQKALGIK